MAPVNDLRARPRKLGYGVGAVPSLAKNPLQFFMQSLLNQGDLVPLNLGPTRLLLVHHPDHVRYVLQDNWRNYSKGSMWVAIRKLVGNGLLASDFTCLFCSQSELALPARRDSLLSPDTQKAHVRSPLVIGQPDGRNALGVDFRSDLLSGFPLPS